MEEEREMMGGAPDPPPPPPPPPLPQFPQHRRLRVTSPMLLDMPPLPVQVPIHNHRAVERSFLARIRSYISNRLHEFRQGFPENVIELAYKRLWQLTYFSGGCLFFLAISAYLSDWELLVSREKRVLVTQVGLICSIITFVLLGLLSRLNNNRMVGFVLLSVIYLMDGMVLFYIRPPFFSTLSKLFLSLISF